MSELLEKLKQVQAELDQIYKALGVPDGWRVVQVEGDKLLVESKFGVRKFIPLNGAERIRELEAELFGVRALQKHRKGSD